MGVSFIMLIMLLIFPIGSFKANCLIYNCQESAFVTMDFGSKGVRPWLNNPFIIKVSNDMTFILVAQTIVFTLVAIVFVVFSVLFAIELKRADVFKHRPTKAERLQAQIDELQKQVDDLKKGE